MQHLTDDMIAHAVTAEQAQAILRDAYTQFHHGRAAVQQRERTQSADVKLSTLGAVIPDLGVVGAKVYTTIQGHFGFVVLLFSIEDGRPLATLDAGALTRIRTAACSVLAARACLRATPETMGLFGLGVQGTEHAIQMAQAFPLKQLLVSDPYADDAAIERLSDHIRLPVTRTAPADIAQAADILVTASRAKTPLFSGKWLRNDAFIAAIGSSLPNTRELDDDALRRTRRIIVEWKQQTLQEAGDLILAAPEIPVADKLVELGALLANGDAFGERAGAQAEDEPGIYIYKGVGIGLADIALAGLAYRNLKED